jgi:ribosomal protein S18 acetylase RimI-like enzyme
MTFTIKPCTSEDLENLIKVLRQSYLEHYTYLWHDNGAWYMQASFNADRLQEELSNPNSAFFLLHDGQKFVGLIKLNVDSAIDGFSSDTALELERIYFIKEASGKGLGKEAINFVIDFARQRQKTVVWLKAMDSSDAVEFYKKRGFQVISDFELRLPNIKDEYRKMYVMTLHLQ